VILPPLVFPGPTHKYQTRVTKKNGKWHLDGDLDGVLAEVELDEGELAEVGATFEDPSSVHLVPGKCHYSVLATMANVIRRSTAITYTFS
jgi:hypothetical protein